MKIKIVDDLGTSFMVNGIILKLYQQPKSKKEFLMDMLEQSDLKAVDKAVSSLAPPNLFSLISGKKINCKYKNIKENNNNNNKISCEN